MTIESSNNQQQENETMTDERQSEPRVSENQHTVTISTELFYALLQAAGREIDPETAEVEWRYGLTLDPYGVHDLPEEYQQVGREYFACAPDTDLWISFQDLPEALGTLYRKNTSAGLFDDD
jgi:hypothetical protein